MSPNIRLPIQQRSIDAWSRVLDSGVEIMSELGYEGFTIAEICKRAEVAPRFIYDRVDDKDNLFLAVYMHGMLELADEQTELVQPGRWDMLTNSERISAAVHQIGQIFMTHREFLKSVVLISSSVEEISKRGAESKNQFSQQFNQMLESIHSEINHDDPQDAITACFDIVFSAWVVRVAYGREFSSLGLEDAQFDEHLQDMGIRYLLGK